MGVPPPGASSSHRNAIIFRAEFSRLTTERLRTLQISASWHTYMPLSNFRSIPPRKSFSSVFCFAYRMCLDPGWVRVLQSPTLLLGVLDMRSLPPCQTDGLPETLVVDLPNFPKNFKGGTRLAPARSLGVLSSSSCHCGARSLHLILCKYKWIFVNSIMFWQWLCVSCGVSFRSTYLYVARHDAVIKSSEPLTRVNMEELPRGRGEQGFLILGRPRDTRTSSDFHCSLLQPSVYFGKLMWFRARLCAPGL